MGEEFIASKERERKCGQQTTQKSHIVPTLERGISRLPQILLKEYKM